MFVIHEGQCNLRTSPRLPHSNPTIHSSQGVVHLLGSRDGLVGLNSKLPDFFPVVLLFVDPAEEGKTFDLTDLLDNLLVQATEEFAETTLSLVLRQTVGIHENNGSLDILKTGIGCSLDIGQQGVERTKVLTSNVSKEPVAALCVVVIVLASDSNTLAGEEIGSGKGIFPRTRGLVIPSDGLVGPGDDARASLLSVAGFLAQLDDFVIQATSLNVAGCGTESCS